MAAGLNSAAKAQFTGFSHNPDTVTSVSLLTAAPGKEVYQLEGHSGLRFRTASGTDLVANWGLFDFNTPNFIYRFVKGETDYCVGLIPADRFILEYMREGRRVTEQTLNLTPEECGRLYDDVITAARPENRTYRYNYVLDNCATRPVAYIERATGCRIRFPEACAGLDGKVTFRNVMRHFHRNYPWYQFGIDMALGSGIDSLISVRSSGFAPVVLQQIAAHATIGDSVPLVRQTSILVPGAASGPILPPTPWFLTPLAAMWTLAGITLLCGLRLFKPGHRYWQPVLAAFFLIAGIAGCIVAFLVCVSSHEATAPNWIILWINPVCLIVPIAVWCKKSRRLLQIYFMANITMVAVYGITCLFGTQSPNHAFLPLALADAILSLSYLHLYRETSR